MGYWIISGEIQDLVNREFTSEELICLCYDETAYSDVYEKLKQRVEKEVLIDNLLRHINGQGLVESFREVIKAYKPDRFNLFEPYFKTESIESEAQRGNTVSRQFVNRTDQLTDLCAFLESSEKYPWAINVVGRSGSGKTALINRLSDICLERNYGLISLNFGRGFDKYDDVSKHIWDGAQEIIRKQIDTQLQQAEVTLMTEEAYEEATLNLLRPPNYDPVKLVMIIDGYEYLENNDSLASKLFNGIVHRLNKYHQGKFKLVLSGQTRHIRIQYIERDERADLIRVKNFKKGDIAEFRANDSEWVEAVYHLYKGYPLLTWLAHKHDLDPKLQQEPKTFAEEIEESVIKIRDKFGETQQLFDICCILHDFDRPLLCQLMNIPEIDAASWNRLITQAALESDSQQKRQIHDRIRIAFENYFKREDEVYLQQLHQQVFEFYLGRDNLSDRLKCLYHGFRAKGADVFDLWYAELLKCKEVADISQQAMLFDLVKLPKEANSFLDRYEGWLSSVQRHQILLEYLDYLYQVQTELTDLDNHESNRGGPKTISKLIESRNLDIVSRFRLRYLKHVLFEATSSDYQNTIDLISKLKSNDPSLQPENKITLDKLAAKCWLRFGILYLSDDHLDEAEKAFNAALDLCPENNLAKVDILYHLGETHFKAKEQDKALEVIHQCRELTETLNQSSRQLKALKLLISIYRSLKHYRAALNTVDEAKKLIDAIGGSDEDLDALDELREALLEEREDCLASGECDDDIEADTMVEQDDEGILAYLAQLEA